jgi:serine/threonine kinase 17
MKIRNLKMKFFGDESMDVCIKISKEPLSMFYDMLSELGRGKFAVVKRCLHLNSGEERAAKIQRKRRRAVDCRAEILEEIRMLDAVRGHPNIVELIEVFESNHEIIIITEYVGGGELGNHLLMEERLNESETIHVTSEVLHALIYLHDKQLVHMDLKPQNLLLLGRFPNCRIKLCDFGLMRFVDSSSVIREIIGTPDYVAPEVLDYEPLQTACDIWSLGVLVYVLLTGFSPFSGETRQEMYLNISQVNLDFPSDLFSSISPQAVDFIRKLLLADPH